MFSVNNQCEYAVYAEVEPRAEAHNYLDYNLPFGIYFSYYPDTVEYTQADSSDFDSGNSKFVHLSYSFSNNWANDDYYQVNILPLFPEGWENKLPASTSFHFLYNRELYQNKDYSANAIYGCIYIQYVGNGNYVRLDKYLNLNLVPYVPSSDEDIFFLYHLGQRIMNNVLVDGLLDLNINGVTFFNVLFGGGFIVFCTWCIVKWIIPL